MRNLAVVMLLAIVVFCGCSRGKVDDDGTVPAHRELPAITLRDDTPNLLLTWIDEKGNFHRGQHPQDVPESGRTAVRVVVAEPDFQGDGDMVYVADLTKKTDGTYLVQSLPRSQWEQMAESRRSKTMEGLAARPAPAPSSTETPPGNLGSNGRLSAIIYGSSYCPACREAARYLKSKGVLVVELDIEKNAQAAQEMRRKLAKAGMPVTGSIPVLDLDGRMMVGLDKGQLDAWISSRRNATKL